MINDTTNIIELTTTLSLNQIFSFFHTDEDAVFLDSSLENALGRYSYAGLFPYLKATDINGSFYLNNKKQEGSLSDWLKQYLERKKEKKHKFLPFTSGCIGYFSYDYGRREMNIFSNNPSCLSIPDALFVFYSVILIEEKSTKRIFAATYKKQGKLALEKILSAIKDTISPLPLSEPPLTSEITSDFTKEEYQNAISRFIQYIIEGDTYIGNLTRQIKVKSTRHPFDTFQRLRLNNPSPFGGYFNYGDFQIVSSSPERFLSVNKNIVRTRPIKGTRKRGSSQSEDERLKQELLHSVKDRSELLMVVDLERNDLNKVCVAGSVNVSEIFNIEEYSTVFHLVSNIEGRLRKDACVMDLINAAFPGGSITGTPKFRTMEIIDELERHKRGLYTGSMGYIGFDGDCDFNIVIRTALFQNNIYYIGVGGGITYESDVKFEYEETRQKAKALIEAIR